VVGFKIEIRAYPQPITNNIKMKIELTSKEAHDLYDMMYMIEAGTIKINNAQESFNSIFEKLEKYCFPELKDKAKNTQNAPIKKKEQEEKQKDIDLIVRML